MVSTQIMTWVYKDSFIFDTHQVSIYVWLILQFWKWSGRLFDTIIDFVNHHTNFQKVSYYVIKP